MKTQENIQLTDFKVSDAYQWHQKIIYNFIVEYKGTAFAGFVSESFSENDTIPDRTLTWETPGHPELDYYNEQKVIEKVLEHITNQ